MTSHGGLAFRDSALNQRLSERERFSAVFFLRFFQRIPFNLTIQQDASILRLRWMHKFLHKRTQSPFIPQQGEKWSQLPRLGSFRAGEKAGFYLSFGVKKRSSL